MIFLTIPISTRRMRESHVMLYPFLEASRRFSASLPPSAPLPPAVLAVVSLSRPSEYCSVDRLPSCLLPVNHPANLLCNIEFYDLVYKVWCCACHEGHFSLLYGFSSAISTKGRRNIYRVESTEREREREKPISCWSLYLISSREIDFSHSLPFLLAAQASQSITRNSSSSPESSENSYKCTWL